MEERSFKTASMLLRGSFLFHDQQKITGVGPKDLARRLLKPYEASVPPTSPLSSSDEILLSVQKQLSGVPPNLFASLEDGPEIYSQCPLSTIYEGEDKVSCARSLDARLKLFQDGSQAVAPEIRLEEPSGDATPEISLTSFDSALTGSNNPMTLLPSKAYSFGNAHPLHCSALLRLLYLHTSINPANRSPHIASLLIPVYSALNQEIEPEELSHVEADTFWVFEAIVAEFSELEEEGGNKWMKKLSERLLHADAELFEDLVGLFDILLESSLKSISKQRGWILLYLIIRCEQGLFKLISPC